MQNSVQNTQYLQGFPWAFQGCSDVVQNGGFHVISSSREVEYAVASHRWPKVAAIDATNSSFHGAKDELLGLYRMGMTEKLMALTNQNMLVQPYETKRKNDFSKKIYLK